jgi:hypothetical protein
VATKKTEADLEARLHAVLGAAFPWLHPDALSHQTRFSVRLGRADIPVDGTRERATVGRADIVVSSAGKHLAVVELKRADLPLTPDDLAQGLSYARLLEPMAPFVILSNGTDTQIYLTYIGERWVPKDHTEAELQKRLETTGQLAASDRQNSIEVLMGADDDHWVFALQAVSKQLIADRSGGWNDPFTPFVRNFLIPRRVSGRVVAALNGGKRVVVVHGPPLSGKSIILRELVDKADKSDGTAVLLIEPNQAGLFVALASLLSSELAWKVTADDAREWLRGVSRNTHAKLVVAVDGIDPSHQAVIADLEDLASPRFGEHLNVVIALDDSVLDAVTRKPNHRERTTIGRAAVEVGLEPLDDGEFEIANKVLADNRIGITSGGESVLSLREPWALRVLIPHEIAEMPADGRNLIVRIPPLIDLSALQRADEGFSGDHELMAALARTSRAVLAHYVGPRKSEVLRRRDFLKPGVDRSGNAVWFVRVPTIMAAHIAIALADEMSSWGDAEQIAKKLVTVASKLPFGDVTAALAIAHRIGSGKEDTVPIIEALLANEPKAKPMEPGHRFAFVLHDRIGEATLLEGGKIALHVDGRTHTIDWDEEEGAPELADLGGWLILSHLALLPLGLQTSDAQVTGQLDEVLLEHIGRADRILSRPEGGQDFRGIAVHDVPGQGSVVCHKSGVVEPITWALMQFFLRRGDSATDWIVAAAQSKSLPLLTRTHIALVQIKGVADARGKWADEMLDVHIVPAIGDLQMYH